MKRQKKKFTDADIERITGARYHKQIKVPFYYAPPFLKQLQRNIESRLTSSGGRPTLQGAEIERVVRFLPEDWKELQQIAEEFSESGRTVSPAQVASSIVSQALHSKPKR